MENLKPKTEKNLEADGQYRLDLDIETKDVIKDKIQNNIPNVEAEAEEEYLKAFEKERILAAIKYGILDKTKLKKGNGPSGWDYDFYGDVSIYSDLHKEKPDDYKHFPPGTNYLQ